MARFIVLVLVSASLATGQGLVRITDTVYHADGSPASGELTITLMKKATTASKNYIAASIFRVPLRPGGVLDVSLVPNDAMVPPNAYYQVDYSLAKAPTKYSERWIVPTGSVALKIADVLSETPSAWTGYPLIKPLRIVSSLPSICAPGDYVHLSTAPMGSNTYACVLPNTWVLQGGGVLSVFGRLGHVTAQAGDYTAAQISNTPSGNISALSVQLAVNELDAEKAPVSHGHAASDITSGVLPVARGGTGLGSLIGNRCIQSDSNGTGFIETAGPCGEGVSEGRTGAYVGEFVNSSTWVVPGSTHRLETCDLSFETWISDGSGRLQVTQGWSSVKCEPDQGSDQYDVTVTWPSNTSGRLILISSGGPGSYVGEFSSSTTWTLPGSVHGLGTCDMGFVAWVSDGDGRLQATHGWSSVRCEPDPGSDQYDVVVSWPSATAGRLLLLKSGVGGAGGGGGNPGGTSGQVQFNNSGVFDGVQGSSVSGSLVTFGSLVVNTSYAGPSGTTLPSTCAVGQEFFKTDAPAGRNKFGCTSSNTWTLLGDGGEGVFNPADDYDMSGNNVINASVITVRKGNSSVGTVQHRLVCIDANGLVATCTTANASRTIGVCHSGCGTFGSARIAIAGSSVSCQFDGSVTAGNWVAPSTSQAGLCTDAGTNRPTTALGILNETGPGSGTYTFTKGIL